MSLPRAREATSYPSGPLDEAKQSEEAMQSGGFQLGLGRTEIQALALKKSLRQLEYVNSLPGQVHRHPREKLLIYLRFCWDGSSISTQKISLENDVT
jgi:hypothetical protein